MSGKKAKLLRASQSTVVAPPRRRFSRLVLVVLLFATGSVIAAAVAIGVIIGRGPARTMTLIEPPADRIIDPSLIDPETHTVRKWPRVASLEELLKLTPQQLENVDIAEMNLLCATGLPGAEAIDIPDALLNLDTSPPAFASRQTCIFIVPRIRCMPITTRIPKT